MILPPKRRLGFILLLIGAAALLVAGGSWAVFAGYGYVLVNAASGAAVIQQLNDLLVLQSATLSVAAAVSALLAIALAILYLTERRIAHNAGKIVESLKAFAAGDWNHPPRVRVGDVLDEVAAAAGRLADVMRTKGRQAAPSDEAEEIKTRFLEIISHQLRTPLTAVRWNFESLLRGEEGPLNRKQTEILRITDKNYQNILVMLSDWIEALEVERGLLQLNPESIDVGASLKVLAEEFKNQAQLKKIVFRLEVEKGLPSVYADKLKFHFILSKLLHNAMSYSAEDGHVTLRAGLADRMIRFEVEDGGVGIPPEEQPRIFKKFFRASNAALMQPSASGVGLFVAKTLVEAHGGTIAFSSVEGRGTVFSFTLPVSQAPRLEPHATAPTPRRPRRPAVPSRSRRRGA